MDKQPYTRKTRRPDTIFETPSEDIIQVAKNYPGRVTPQELGRIPKISEEENTILSKLAHEAGQRREKNAQGIIQELTAEKKQKISEIIKKIHEHFSHNTYDTQVALVEARKKNVILENIINDTIEKTFNEYTTAHTKITGGIKEVADKEAEENNKNLIKNIVLNTIIEKFEEFLFPTENLSKDNEIKKIILNLPEDMQEYVNNEYNHALSRYDDAVKNKFASDINLLVTHRIEDQWNNQMRGGLLRVPNQTNSVLSQENTITQQEKKSGKISGLFKRLFS